MLDTRQYRSDQVGSAGDAPITAEVRSPERTLLGTQQERWLSDGLAKGSGRWQLIAQQVMLMQLAQLRDGDTQPRYAMDQWSGYLHARGRLLDHIIDRRLTNVMTVSGDAHRHFAGDLSLGVPAPASLGVTDGLLALSGTTLALLGWVMWKVPDFSGSPHTSLSR